jgi:hypothetical protein
MDCLHDIHNYAPHLMQLASNGMETGYDKLAKCAGFQEGENVWFCRPSCLEMLLTPHDFCDDSHEQQMQTGVQALVKAVGKEPPEKM